MTCVNYMSVWQAAAEGFHKRVARLVALQPNLNTSYGAGPFHHATPLMIACKFGNLNVVEVLSLTATIVNMTRHHWYSAIRRYDHFFSALHFASDGGYFEIVKLLVQKGASHPLKAYEVAKTEEIRLFLLDNS